MPVNTYLLKYSPAKTHTHTPPFLGEEAERKKIGQVEIKGMNEVTLQHRAHNE